MRTLENLAKAVYNDFATEYKITDYPKLHHVFAVIMMESSWNPNAESPYARGLMQISKSALDTINALYEKKYTYDDLFNPSINLWVGIRYLRWLYRAFETFENREMLSIMAYNWGIKRVIDWLSLEKDNVLVDESVPLETRNYLCSYVYWTNVYKHKIKE